METEAALARITPARVKPGPIRVAQTRWVTPTGKRSKKGKRPAKSGGFGAVHRALVDVPKLRGKLSSFQVSIRLRDSRGRFVKIVSKRIGMPDERDTRKLRRQVEDKIRREVFRAEKTVAREYPTKPRAGASRAEFERWRKRLKRYKGENQSTFKVEVFREVTGGEGSTAGVRQRRRRKRKPAIVRVRSRARKLVRKKPR